jgi:hypothetical protein
MPGTMARGFAPGRNGPAAQYTGVGHRQLMGDIPIHILNAGRQPIPAVRGEHMRYAANTGRAPTNTPGPVPRQRGARSP